jgi:hypothetical protein
MRMCARGPIDAVASHSKPDENDETRKGPFLVRQLSVSRNGGLGRAISEFVSARLGPDGVESRHKGLYWFRQE